MPSRLVRRSLMLLAGAAALLGLDPQPGSAADPVVIGYQIVIESSKVPQAVVAGPAAPARDQAGRSWGPVTPEQPEQLAAALSEQGCGHGQPSGRQLGQE